MNGAEFAAMVDHTVLAATTTADDVDRICEEAVQFGTAAVCVNPLWVTRVRERLSGSPVRTCSVVGFPLGAETAAGTAATAMRAIDDGATEIDMVIPLGLLLADDESELASHLSTVCSVPAEVKVILESGALTEEQIVRACQFSVDAGAAFVKTSTGFHSSGGATAAAVELMRRTVGPHLGVKASGGIRTMSDVEAMVAAGANRLGMSATAAVFDEFPT